MITARLKHKLEHLEKVCISHKKKTGQVHPLRGPLITALRPLYAADYKIGLKQIHFYLEREKIEPEVLKLIKREL